MVFSMWPSVSQGKPMMKKPPTWKSNFRTRASRSRIWAVVSFFLIRRRVSSSPD